MGTENYLGKGFYEAKVRVWIDEIEEWRVKKDLSTFFPDNWSPQRIQEELAIAFKNKKFDKFNAYDGEMSARKSQTPGRSLPLFYPLARSGAPLKSEPP